MKIKNINNLEKPEREAIEMKYLGNSISRISNKLSKSFDTVNGWFKNGGKLFDIYNEYKKERNKKDYKNVEIKTWYITAFAYEENGDKRYNGTQFSSEKRGEDLIIEIKKHLSKIFFEQEIFTENGNRMCIINLTDIT